MKTMKIRNFIIALAVLLPVSVSAQTVYSIVTNPAEDTSSAMRISWASDVPGTYVMVRPVDGRNTSPWNVHPEKEETCTAYDGNPSRMADGTNYNESAVFLKCGATLTSLKKDTEYIYNICSSDGRRISEDHRFKTSGARKWSCTVISDFHSYTPIPSRLASATELEATIRKFDPYTDWILHLGDVTAWGGSYSFWKTMYAEPMFSGAMVAGLNGNHDNMTRTNGQSGDFFRYANYLPDNGYGDQKGICYHFMYSDVLFIMLNNEAMKTDEELAAAQDWVRKVISDQKASRHKPSFIVVCEHYQWFYGKDGAFSQFSRWNKLFDELGVDLALGANNHIYVRSNPIKDGRAVGAKKGTVYLQTSSADNERGEEMDEAVSQNADLIASRWTEGAKTISGLDMKVTPKKITIYLIDRYGNVQDDVVIPRK